MQDRCPGVDLRLTETGNIDVIEVDANGYLEAGSELAQAARAEQ